MSNKQRVRELLEGLSEHVTLQEIAKEIEFMAGVREVMDEVHRGGVVPVGEVRPEEIEKMIASRTAL